MLVLERAMLSSATVLSLKGPLRARSRTPLLFRCQVFRVACWKVLVCFFNNNNTNTHNNINTLNISSIKALLAQPFPCLAPFLRRIVSSMLSCARRKFLRKRSRKFLRVRSRLRRRPPPRLLLSSRRAHLWLLCLVLPAVLAWGT